MKFQEQKFYHIYNRGNNREPIFFEEENYYFFLKKMRRHISLYAHIIAYSLMPNHFHWLLFTKNSIHKPTEDHPLNLQIGTLLSSYTKAINNRYERTGSLFQQQTKAVSVDTQNYALTCFHYIHQNPIRAGLVKSMKHWPYSSYRDYIGVRNGTLVTKELAYDMLHLNKNTFPKESIQAIDPKKIRNIF